LFTELRKRPTLCQELWPVASHLSEEGFTAHLRAREQRRALLASVLRLGHAFVDLWALAALRLGTLERGAQEHGHERAAGLVSDFLDLLEQQRGRAGLTAYRELADVGRHHELIVAANFPGLERVSLRDLPTHFAHYLGSQEPVAGMFGEVTPRLVT